MRAALSHGDQVTSVGWSREDAAYSQQNWQGQNSIELNCDVRIRESVDEVVNKSIEHWGRVDVVAKYNSITMLAPN